MAFKVKVLKPDHPTVEGIPEFESGTMITNQMYPVITVAMGFDLNDFDQNSRGKYTIQ